jgi:DNA (cytosine-5)-methyltransferase 1
MSNIMSENILTAIDLFCGCGGISAGIRRAGFKVLAGVDLEPKYITTFSHNFPESNSLTIDLSKLPAQEFMKMLGLQQGELALLAGGPPCQGFSKNVPRKLRYIDSPNNLLVKTFLHYCEILQPKSILMENVAEMKNGFEQAYTEEILECLNKYGYTVSYSVLNAANYGVPQRRRRAFFIANNQGTKLQFPARTHTSPTEQQSLFRAPTHISVWDAIGDLPSLNNGEGKSITPYKCLPFSDYQSLVRNGQHSVTNHISRQLKPLQFERIASLMPGQGLKDLPKHLQVKGGYSGAYGRLTKDMVAPTITRWVFHPGSGRWGHPEDVRILTIREAARIQGFPDSFEFIGSYTQQAGQLGNAVPPILVEQIIKSIMHQLSLSNFAINSMKSCKDNFSSGVGMLNVAM